MKKKTISKKFIYLLVSILVISSFSACMGGKELKEYNKLLKSYEKDRDYKKSTTAIKKIINSNNGKRLAHVFNNTTGSAFNWIISNKGDIKGIPILAYHCVDSSIWGDRPMFVSPDNFDRQMRYLRDQGYETITFRDLSQLHSIKKPVLITFDDGYENNYTNAYPILKKYEFKATIFLVADFIDKPKFLKLEEIRKMRDIIDFQSHTMTHRHLAALDPAKIEFELSESKKRLEYLLGKKIDIIAYPYGSYDSSVLDIAKKYYAYGVTTNYGKFVDVPANEYTIKRMYVLNQMDLDKFIKLFN